MRMEVEGRRSADCQSAVSPNGIRQEVEGSQTIEPAGRCGLPIRDTADCQSALRWKGRLRRSQCLPAYRPETTVRFSRLVFAASSWLFVPRMSTRSPACSSSSGPGLMMLAPLRSMPTMLAPVLARGVPGATTRHLETRGSSASLALAKTKGSGHPAILRSHRPQSKPRRSRVATV